MSKLILIAVALLFSTHSMADDHVKQTNKFIVVDDMLINTDSIGAFDGRIITLTSGATIALSDSPTDIYKAIYATTEDYEPVLEKK